MFTGLIQGRGRVIRVEKVIKGLRLFLRPLFSLDDLKIGDSIAVSGVCLTVVDIGRDGFSVELSPETISRTTFSYIRQGQEVNLEQPLRLGDRIGGHLVTGHVDTVGTVTDRRERGENIIFAFSIPDEWMPYVVEKGSIAIDGISLTVNRCFREGFEVNIIPYTAKVTTIGQCRIGDKVNIETDIIGKYVLRLLSSWQDKKIDKSFLKRHGFW